MNINYIARKSDNIVIEIQNSRSATADEYIVEDVRHLSELKDISGVYLYEIKNGKIIERNIQILPEYIQYYKNLKLNGIKQKANEVITKKYPEWKQINLTADREFALGFIAKLKSKTNDEVNSEIADKLMGKSASELKSIRDDFESFDISDLLIGIPLDYIPITKMYYQWIANSFIAYVLCKEVRNWSDAQEVELGLCTTIEQINAVSTEYEEL